MLDLYVAPIRFYESLNQDVYTTHVSPNPVTFVATCLASYSGIT